MFDVFLHTRIAVDFAWIIHRPKDGLCVSSIAFIESVYEGG